MRIGLMLGDGARDLDGVVRQADRARQAGLSSAWMSQIFGFDAMGALAVVGHEVPGIELGTAVVPTYPRHPMVMATQAMTTQSACGGRFVLGIGLSHKIVTEGMYGYSFDRPARHMAEYLSILVPLVREGSASFEGETLKWSGPLQVPGASPCPILLAALAPRMLKLAGGVADGTVTWMTGPKTIASHIVPSLTKASKEAGRPAPRVVVSLPVSVTANVEAARETAAQLFSIYGQLPSYRAMLDKEGAEGPAQVAIVGDEESVAGQIGTLLSGGATDFVASVFGSREERDTTFTLLSELARR